MYQALYRKWRPRTFDDVVGQEHITETLKNQVRLGRTSHAYIFVGTRGTGKTTCAKILARAVNCEHPVDGNPCNRCPSCLGIENGSIMDVEELDAASNNGVDNVRALRDEAIYSPAHVKKRVYIVDEVHMLSTSAFNALLKILEEPPEHLMFILATTELRKVPATILSRCQRHSFKRIDERDIARRLGYVAEEEGLQLTADAATLLARLGDGSMRDALSLLDQCAGGSVIDAESVLSSMGLAGTLRTAELVGAIADGDSAAALNQFDSLWRDGKDIASLVGEMSALVRDIMINKIASGSSPLLSGSYEPATLRELGAKFSDAELLRAAELLQKTAVDLKNGSDQRVPVELCIVELCMRVSAPTAAPQERVAPRPQPRPAAKPAPEPEPIPEPVQKAEPEPMSEPEPMPEPKLVSAEAASAPENFWDRLLEGLRSRVAPGNFSFLSASYHCTGAVEGGEVVIRAKNEFALSMVDKPEVLSAVKAEAAALLGGAVPVRFELDRGVDAPDTQKLDSLSKFSNFKMI